jgi:hypothetical protein
MNSQIVMSPQSQNPNNDSNIINTQDQNKAQNNDCILLNSTQHNQSTTICKPQNSQSQKSTQTKLDPPTAEQKTVRIIQLNEILQKVIQKRKMIRDNKSHFYKLKNEFETLNRKMINLTEQIDSQQIKLQKTI